MTIQVEVCTQAIPLANIANVGVEFARLIEATLTEITFRSGVPRERLNIRSVAPCSVAWGTATMLVVTIVADVVP